MCCGADRCTTGPSPAVAGATQVLRPGSRLTVGLRLPTAVSDWPCSRFDGDLASLAVSQLLLALAYARLNPL